MSRTSKLYDLQLIDTQLDQHRSRIKEIATILANNLDLIRAEENLKKMDGDLASGILELRDSEKLVRDQRLKIKVTDAKLYGGKISNPKELKDLQDEGEALKRYLSILEDRQLECMLTVDDLGMKRENAQDFLDKVTRNSKQLHSELVSEKKTIESKILELDTRRNSISNTISPEDTDVYERLRSQRFGVAVSRVSNQACSACGATLTAALHQAARSPNQITHCETCGRILFN